MTAMEFCLYFEGKFLTDKFSEKSALFF